VISTSSQCTTVFRSVLVNGNQFEEYVNRIGRPQFAITCAGDQFDEQGPGLAPDEWLFADDIERLMMDFFAWDARGTRMELISPIVSGKKSASWIAVGLADYLNKSASHLNAARLGTVCKAMGADGARKAFLESIFASSAEFVGGFDLPIWFFDLCSAQAQAYPPSLPVGKPTCLSLAHRRLVHRCEALGG
jgi:hypothetical protein